MSFETTSPLTAAIGKTGISGATDADAMWRLLHACDPAALATQSPEWGNAVACAGGFRRDPQYLEFDGGGRAMLPLFSKGIGPLRYAWSPPPAWGFGGPLTDRRLSPAQLGDLLAHVEALPYLGVKIRPNPLDADLWSAAVGGRPGWEAIPRHAHVIDLGGGFDTVAGRFKSSAGTNIRRARRMGVEVVVGNSDELIDDFYGLLERTFARWARKQHEPVLLARMRGERRDPRRKFTTMATQLGNRFRLYVARWQGRPIAAILVLMDRQAHYTRAAMDEEPAGETRASYLLQATAIEEACRLGCTHYHMGETGSSSSLAQFKSRFGALGVAYAEYRYERVPLARVDGLARRTVKKLIGFRDAS